MAKTDFKTIKDYIATFPEADHRVLEAIRDTIAEAVPEAEPTISYQIPAFKYHGWIFYFSAFAKHYALSCPPPWTVFEAFEKELAPYKRSKSTIQFPKDAVPYALIAEMASFRAGENRERAEAKKAAKG